MIDVIMLANTTNLTKYGMTQRAINSLRWSDSIYDFDIILVETNKDYLEQGFVYDNVNEVVVPNEPFGYNQFLNHGLKARQKKHDWVIVTNNDVTFTQGWFEALMNFHTAHPEFRSMSPWEPNWHENQRKMDSLKDYHEGYRTSYEITGWCLVMHRDVITECNLFDPDFEFWYQDNDYAKELETHKIKHALVTDSRVYHMVSGSHDLLTEEQKARMTDAQINVLFKKWGPNV